MNDFCDRLQHVISLKKITQADIVAQTGINKSSISLWVNGKITPGAKNLHVLSDFLKCSYEWLAEGKGDPFPMENFKTAENVASFEPYKAARDADLTLAKILREKFKQQCTVHLDEFFDFIAENYGESKEGIDQFLAELHNTHSNYRVWLEEKKYTDENLQIAGKDSLAANSK